MNLDYILLKVILNNKTEALKFVNQYETKLFSKENWSFAHTVVSYIKTYKEIPTINILKDKIKNQRTLELYESTWKEIDKLTVDDREFHHHVFLAKKRYTEEMLSRMKDSFVNDFDLTTQSSIEKIISDTFKNLSEIKKLDVSKAFENKDLKEYLPSFVERYNAIKKDPNFDVGLKTKYSFIDFATNGFKPADMLLIAGESGFGKSLFLNNIAKQVWLQDNTIYDETFTQGKNIIYFSLEMPYEDCFNRLLSCLTGIPSRLIERANLTKEQFAKIKQTLTFINNYPYKFKIVDLVDPCAKDIEMILEDENIKYDAIFVDYLGIMKPNESSGDQDWLEQGTISYELRGIARKLQVPMFSAVQLNRKKEAKDPSTNIGLHRLARSGTVATHATHIIQIENRENEDDYPDFIYHFIKNRKGPKGKASLTKKLFCASLIDIPFVEDIFGNPDFVDSSINDISEEMEQLLL